MPKGVGYPGNSMMPMGGGGMKDGSRMSMPSVTSGVIMPGGTDPMRQTKTKMASMPTMAQEKGSVTMAGKGRKM